MEHSESVSDLPVYVAPEYVSVEDIIHKDESDQSLAKYKATLLGEAPEAAVVDPNDQRVVILKSITLLVDGRPDVVMELSDPKSLNYDSFRIREGALYRLKYTFIVQRDIVTGLRCTHKIYRLCARISTEKTMVGSYAPKAELQTYITPLEEAPSGAGLLHRGTYKVKSQLTDDDGNDWLSWEWQFTVTKEW